MKHEILHSILLLFSSVICECKGRKGTRLTAFALITFFVVPVTGK
jgi:hypothetical protein